MATTNGRVRYVDYYWNAPINAKYILRMVYTGAESVLDYYYVLERYYGVDLSKRLAEFAGDAFFKENFETTLRECRNIINGKETLWVEKPDWMD